MNQSFPHKVAYVLKRYPRFSETFIVNEILAHESAGLSLDIFSLRSPEDTHFQDAIARVRAPVTYLRAEGLRASGLWSAIATASGELPGLWNKLETARDTDVREVYQAVLLARTVRRNGIGHLHAHFATSATNVARLAAHFADIPYSFTAHAKDIFHQDTNPDDLRRKLSTAAAVVTVSDFNLAYLCEQFGPAAARVRRIYNGLDLRRFDYQPPGVRDPVIVAAGRLIEKKGFGDVVAACAILAARGVKFRCQIIGTGELTETLRRQIDELVLGDHVEMLGARPQSDLIRYLHNAAVFAAPCVVGADGNRDGLPTVVLEAMALGTPCVATDVTGLPEVVRNVETGLMVPQHNPTALADAIARLLADPALRVRLAARARKLIEAEFDIEQNAARLRSVFAGAA